MKQLRLFIAVLAILLLGFIKSANAQHVMVRTYIEQTKVGPKSGVSAAYVSKFGFEVGGFYQNERYMNSIMVFDQNPSQFPKEYEQEFYGFLVAAPVITREDFQSKVVIRTGLINNEYLTITPTFLTEIKPYERVSMGLGVGFRAFRPTWQGSIGFTF